MVNRKGRKSGSLLRTRTFHPREASSFRRNIVLGDFLPKTIQTQHPKPHFGNHSIIKSTKCVKSDENIVMTDISTSTIEDQFGIAGELPSLRKNVVLGNCLPKTMPTQDPKLHFGNHSTIESTKGVKSDENIVMTDISTSRIEDQFGNAGLLTSTQAKKTHPHLGSLALGLPPTSLGMQPSAAEYINWLFSDPVLEMPNCDPFTSLIYPPEAIDLYEARLFRDFYTCCEKHQLAAALALEELGWCYHLGMNKWLSRIPEMVVVNQSSTQEHSAYFVFNPYVWKKETTVLKLFYCQLGVPPIMRPIINHFYCSS